MMLAAHLPRATAVAINPQVEVFNYSKRYVDTLLQLAFPNKTADELKRTQNRRFSLISAYKANDTTKCLIVQNTQDVVHYQRHFRPFCKEFGINHHALSTDSGRILTMVYDDPGGHGAEPRSMVPAIIATAVELSQRHLAGPQLDDLSFRSPIEAKPQIKASQLYLQGAPLPIIPQDGVVVFSPHGRKDVEQIVMELPYDWSSDPYHDSNWRAQLQKWNMLDAYILAFEATKNTAFLEKSKHVILDWYRYHVIERQESSMAWRDFIVGIRAMKVAYLVSCWQHGLLPLSPDELASFRTLAKEHLAFLTDTTNIKFTNHTFSDFHGAMALAHIADAAVGKRVETFVLSNTPRLIRSQFTDEGVHLEHSPGYQGFGIRCLERLAASGWFTKVDIEDWLKKTKQIQPWFRLPDGRIAPVGDTDGKPSTVAKPVRLDYSKPEIFNKAGYCIVRAASSGSSVDASYLFLMGAFHSRVHKHPDNLSILWFEGEDILCDVGKFAYKSHKFRKYAQSTRAHNTIEIDSQDQSTDTENAFGSAIRSVEQHNWGVAITASVAYRPLSVLHTRHILYSPSSWLLVIDRLKLPRDTPVTQWFHFAPGITLKANNIGYSQPLSSSNRKLHVQSAADTPTEQCVVAGQKAPHIQGWISQGYAQVTACDTLGTSAKATNLTLATLFVLDNTESHVRVTQDRKIIAHIARHQSPNVMFDIAANFKAMRITTTAPSNNADSKAAASSRPVLANECSTPVAKADSVATHLPLHVILCGMPRCGTRQFTDFLNQESSICLQGEIKQSLIDPIRQMVEAADRVYADGAYSGRYRKKRAQLLLQLFSHLSKSYPFHKPSATIHGFKTPGIEKAYQTLNSLFLPSTHRLVYFYCIRNISDCYLSLCSMPWFKATPKQFVAKFLRSLTAARQIKASPEAEKGQVAIEILNLDAFIASTDRAQWLATRLFAPVDLQPKAAWLQSIASTTGNRNSTERATGKKRDTQLPADVRGIFLAEKESINAAIQEFNEVFNETLPLFQDSQQ